MALVFHVLILIMVTLCAAERGETRVLMTEVEEASAPTDPNVASKTAAFAPAIPSDALRTSAVEVADPCVKTGTSIKIQEFTPYDASNREKCLKNIEDSTVTMTIPIGKVDNKNGADYTMDLDCTKESDRWDCQTAGILGIVFYTQAGVGGRNTGMVIDPKDNFWCYIANIRLGRDSCKVPALKKYSGTTIAQVAVKLAETLGYPLQHLADGASASCTGTDDKEHTIFLRTSGLLKDGMSFYMAKAGFVPAVPTDGGEGTVKDALRTWCKAVSDLKKTKIDQVLNETCLMGNAGFEDRQVSEGMIEQIKEKCTGNPLFGDCYKKVYDSTVTPGTEEAKKKCDMQNTLVDLIDIGTSWTSQDWVQRAAEIPEENARCGCKTRAIAAAQNYGFWVRFSQGFTRPRYERPEINLQVYPDEVDKFCTDPQLIGWMLPDASGCSEGDCKDFQDENAGIEIKCSSGGRCCIKQGSLVPKGYNKAKYCCNPAGGLMASVHNNKCISAR